MRDFIDNINKIALVMSLLAMGLIVACFFSEIALNIVVFIIIGLIVLSLGALVYFGTEMFIDSF